MNLVLYFGIKLTTRKLKLYMHVKFCFRRRQIHLLATGLSGSRSSGFPRSGEGEGDGDPLDPRPGRRGEDVQVVPPLAQQVSGWCQVVQTVGVHRSELDPQIKY